MASLLPHPRFMVRKAAALAQYRRKRNFTRTAEPAGGKTKRAAAKGRRRKKALAFVIQKHDATQLHFDLRLEVDGVMKSWAVPKGPSLDPAQKRLAMQVEDHPVEYNEFEGTIPEGEYGGGTVMIWDRGTYTADLADEFAGDSEAAMRVGLADGDVKFTLNGERLHGSFVLVRMRSARGKSPWLLIKHRDTFARKGSNIVNRFRTSAVSGRRMSEIASAGDAVWHSKPGTKTATRVKTAGRARATARKRGAPKKRSGRKARTSNPGKPVQPMLATLAREMPEGDGWTYEPKYDGIRVLAYVTPGAARLVTRNDRDKTRQFPEVIAALRKLAGKAGSSLVLDGEIVALVAGEPGRFQELQGRMHVANETAIKRLVKEAPVALVVFDLLIDGEDVLIDEPWTVRRTRLQKRLARRRLDALRLGATSNDALAMLKDAQAHGWEGIMAKRTDAPYRAGKRTRDWLKLKIEQSQEFVVGGYTEPRNTREHLGAILLGYYADGGLIYAGHTGTGFTRASLNDLFRRLHARERATSPFTTTPKTNEKAHWVTPDLVAEVRFNEWTRDGKLRQPVFLGLRDDKDAREVRREKEAE